MKKAVCILFVLLIALSVIPAVAEGYGAKVLTKSMNVYTKPDDSLGAAGALARGTAFTVTAVRGSWARIEYKGREGFAHLKNIIFDKQLKAVIAKDAEGVFVTKASFKKGEKIHARLEAGTKVYVVGFNGEYLLIKNLDGTALGIVKAANVKKYK